ncbi:hypothetical protein ACFQUU_06260 [Herbaspirillum sp. GCM10030257]|uniref:hypothetical protein n=1 Tax=Herbaspirillum sp. GCM10030257 TaxID=3273393 RepID=UPI003609D10E
MNQVNQFARHVVDNYKGVAVAIADGVHHTKLADINKRLEQLHLIARQIMKEKSDGNDDVARDMVDESLIPMTSAVFAELADLERQQEVLVTTLLD